MTSWPGAAGTAAIQCEMAMDPDHEVDHVLASLMHTNDWLTCHSVGLACHFAIGRVQYILPKTQAPISPIHCSNVFAAPLDKQTNSVCSQYAVEDLLVPSTLSLTVAHWRCVPNEQHLDGAAQITAAAHTYKLQSDTWHCSF